MILLCVVAIIAICSAQEATDFVKLDNGSEAKTQKQHESIEALLRQVGDMGMLLENYRRVILSGITEANDICGFIGRLSDTEDNNSLDHIPDGNLILFHD